MASARDGWQFNPARYRDRRGASGNDLGRVFNLLVSGTIRPGYACTLGSAFYTPGGFATAAAGRSQMGRWIYLEVGKTVSLL